MCGNSFAVVVIVIVIIVVVVVVVARSIMHSRRVIGHSFPTWLAAASFCSEKSQDRACAAPSVFAYRCGEIMMARRTLVDIGWRPPVLLSAGTHPPVPWVISRNSDYSLAAELIREESLPTRSTLAMLIRSYKPIFTLRIGSADWWYVDGKPVRKW